ncbi:MAG: thioredoxin-disulfide reductase [Candidatus Eisenbacteria bacterium]
MAATDVIIVGAGPAGLTAGLYASRSGLATTIYERGLPGGLAASAALIENYPGFPEGISGMDLGERMHEQAKKFGAKIVSESVDRVRKDGNRILVSVKGEDIAARSVIIAAGSTPKSIGVPGERSLTGKGVSYCATCDGPLYKDALIAVIGGGDSALQEAIFLAKFGSKVTVIHRRDELRAASVLQKEVSDNPKIELALNKNVKSIEGDSEVKGVLLEDKKTHAEEMIAVDGVFIYVGLNPNVAMLGPEFERGKSGFLVTDCNLVTSVAGVLAAGDVREKELRQISTAVGEGAIAAMSAYAYLESLDKQA